MRIALLVLVLLVTLALSSARRDTAPPQLYFEVAERVPAAEPFDLFLSADEPVSYRVDYGDLSVEQVSQDLTVSFLALSGSNEIAVVAVDGAGNETSRVVVVEGIPVPEPRLEAPESVRAGDPLTVVARWSDDGAELMDASLDVAGAPARRLARGDSLIALLSVPLGSAEAIWPAEVRLVDEFGRVGTATAEVRVLAGETAVQELNVSASTLSVITPAGRELEREAFERAFAESEYQPLWERPFLLPIEGRSTSGFALPRRYAPGGPVSYHEGSDIAAPEGTPIRATNDGVVRVAAFFPIKGGLTIIDHGLGVTSLYFHQSRILIEAGERVAQGQVIGEVGSTGLSTGPHLHWEMRVSGEPSNPMSWVGKTWP